MSDPVVATIGFRLAPAMVNIVKAMEGFTEYLQSRVADPEMEAEWLTCVDMIVGELKVTPDIPAGPGIN